MSFFLGRKGKSALDLVKATKETLVALEKTNEGDSKYQKYVEQLSNYTQQMKVILYGDLEHEPNSEACVQLQSEIHTHDLIQKFVSELKVFDFEARKDVASIINNLLRRESSGQAATADYIGSNPSILETLVDGYQDCEIALSCGSILRECIKHEQLARYLLYSPCIYKFFEYVEVSNFDTASDAFATFKELLTQHKSISADFLEKNYDEMFKAYKALLNSQNYVTRRLSLKLLAELLLDRAHFNIMTKYIRDPENLKLMMNLLRERSKSIQFEAFHVFKVFVANPNKPKPILDILLKNKDKLITFLENFQKEREDEQFKEEKAYLLKQIQQLQEA